MSKFSERAASLVKFWLQTQDYEMFFFFNPCLQKYFLLLCIGQFRTVTHNISQSARVKVTLFAAVRSKSGWWPQSWKKNPIWLFLHWLSQSLPMSICPVTLSNCSPSLSLIYLQKQLLQTLREQTKHPSLPSFAVSKNRLFNPHAVCLGRITYSMWNITFNFLKFFSPNGCIWDDWDRLEGVKR